MKLFVRNALQLLVVFGMVFFIGCKKSSSSSGNTKTDLLTNGSWKIVSWTITPAYDVDGDGDLDTDLLGSSFGPCKEDDIITFKANNEIILDAGATKCSPSDPQMETGRWDFLNNETQIVTSETTGPDKDTLNILELTKTSFKDNYVSHLYSNQNTTYVIEETYVHW